MRNGNLIDFLFFRRLGVERKFFLFTRVVLSRPDDLLPEDDFFN